MAHEEMPYTLMDTLTAKQRAALLPAFSKHASNVWHFKLVETELPGLKKTLKTSDVSYLSSRLLHLVAPLAGAESFDDPKHVIAAMGSGMCRHWFPAPHEKDADRVLNDLLTEAEVVPPDYVRRHPIFSTCDDGKCKDCLLVKKAFNATCTSHVNLYLPEHWVESKMDEGDRKRQELNTLSLPD